MESEGGVPKVGPLPCTKSDLRFKARALTLRQPNHTRKLNWIIQLSYRDLQQGPCLLCPAWIDPLVPSTVFQSYRPLFCTAHWSIKM